MSIKNIKAIKIQLRSQMKKQRANLEPAKKQELDRRIRERLFSLWQDKSCKQLLVYVSKEIEVDTLKLIEAALRDGKRVAVPRCITQDTQMEFYYIRSMQDLEKGTFGVWEPIPAKCEKVEDFRHALCIVPGLSFDAQGYRLGYGKGYYDRFLNGFDGVTAGICYSMCVKWELPHGYFDKPVDLLVTDRYFRKIHSEKRQDRYTASGRAR